MKMIEKSGENNFAIVDHSILGQLPRTAYYPQIIVHNVNLPSLSAQKLQGNLFFDVALGGFLRLRYILHILAPIIRSTVIPACF